jgi:hypothetical protein
VGDYGFNPAVEGVCTALLLAIQVLYISRVDDEGNTKKKKKKKKENKRSFEPHVKKNLLYCLLLSA